MSTQQLFLVHAPDYTAPETFSKRMSVRPKHLERASLLVKDGVIKVAGGFLTPESIAPGATEKKLIGSSFIIAADTLDAVRKLMEEDIYYTAGVWDKEKLVIAPFVAATKIE